MAKAFDQWNIFKKWLDAKQAAGGLFFHEREIWWCSLGMNVGVEIDGKNFRFERPVLIVRRFNNHMLWIAPLYLLSNSWMYKNGPGCEQLGPRRP